MCVRAFLAAVIFLCAFLTGFAAQPNVVVIITDDQGYGDFSCHGNPVLKTPHLDRLHSESVRFTDFHVAPMCSPTRGQLLTGRDAMKNGCTAVCQGRSMMRADIPTMADFFLNSGYATGHFGKWHLGDSYPHRPQDRGFQTSLHHRAWGITSLADHWGNTYYDPVLSLNGVDRKYEGYCTDIFFNEAKKWIKAQKRAGRPFFLYLPTNTPHVPNVCPEKYAKPYRGTYEGKPMPAEFYGMIANIDENVGLFDSFLKAEGLRDDTILIYMTDNGTQSNQAKDIFNAGMRDKKTSVYEGGHRVPLFVRWPSGSLAHGKDIDELTQVQDLLPTLIDLCSLKLKQRPRLDGLSLGGLLTGKTHELPDRKLVVQYRVSGDPWNPAVVLWDKWRLVNGRQLYHVGRDVGQKTDVADQHPEVFKAMAEHYADWHREARPLFDLPRWITVGSRAANPMILYAQDWTGGYCDNRGGLTAATAQGYWNVVVENAGVYELELRRWPKESKKSLTEGWNGPGDRSRSARPISAANVQVANSNYTLEAIPGDELVRFRIKLPKGKTQLATTFMDAEDRALCSAIYLYVHRLIDNEALALTPVSIRKPQGNAPVGKPKSARTVTSKSFVTSPEDILLASFEREDWGDWVVSGEAFSKGPTLPKGRVNGLQGKKLADTFLANESDAPQGTLTSPTFNVERRYLNFLVGGGSHAGKTCVNLLVDGEVVQSATGPAQKDRSNRKVMLWVSWDLSKYRSKQMQIQLVDRASGGWGHIMADSFILSDRRAR